MSKIDFFLYVFILSLIKDDKELLSEFWSNYGFWKINSFDDIQCEQWNEIELYPNFFVSNYGRFKSCDREVNVCHGGTRTVPAQMLAQCLGTDKYLRLTIGGSRKGKKITAHKQVCLAFHSNIENKKTVNHINSIRFFNIVSNLEWNTHSQNNQHGYDNGRKPTMHLLGKVGDKHPKSKKVFCLTNRKYYGSASEAGRELQISRTCVSDVCNNKYSSIKGFSFQYL